MRTAPSLIDVFTRQLSALAGRNAFGPFSKLPSRPSLPGALARPVVAPRPLEFAPADPAPTPTTGSPVTSPVGDWDGAGLGQLVDLRATQVRRTEDASLTIKTAEGDTVTLTAHSEVTSLKAKLTYAPEGGAAADADGSTEARRGVTKVRLREIQIESSVTLSVEGDLSEEELADIRKLISGLRGLLSGEASGQGHDQDGDRDGDRGDDSSAAGGNLIPIDTSGFPTLASFSLHLERSFEKTRIHVRRLPAPTSPLPLPESPAPTV